MIDFNEFDRRNRERMHDMERAVRQERFAHKVEAKGLPFDLRCWVMSRIEFLSELASHWTGRVRGTLPDAQPRPVLSDCRGT